MWAWAEVVPMADEPRLRAEQRVSADLERFEKLDRLVRGLVDRYEALRASHASLRDVLAEREERIRQLNQGRQDAAKRIDDLIARLDQLDAQGGVGLAAPPGSVVAVDG